MTSSTLLSDGGTVAVAVASVAADGGDWLLVDELSRAGWSFLPLLFC